MAGYTKLIKSGDVIELYQYEKNPVSTGRRKRVPKTTDGVRPSRSPDRRPDNIRRLRKGFIRLVRSNLVGDAPPAFVTLTTGANLSLETGALCFTQFVKTLRSYVGDSFRYIAVPEFQKRGAIHFHVLIWGLSDELIFNETPYVAWCKKSYRQHDLVRRYVDWCFEKSLDPRESRGTRFLQTAWGRGFLDIVPTDGSPKLAGYLAKYMSKTMSDERLGGRRAYYSSRNILRPMLETSAISLAYAKELWGGDIELTSEREFDTIWLGRCIYKMFKPVEI